MNIMAIITAALVAAVLSAVLKQYKPEYSMFISIITGVLVLAAVIAAIQPILSLLNELAEQTGGSVYAEVLLKALAICYITQLARDCCRDAGENAIAGKLETAGKVAIIIISTPMLRELVDTVSGFISV